MGPRTRNQRGVYWKLGSGSETHGGPFQSGFCFLLRIYASEGPLYVLAQKTESLVPNTMIPNVGTLINGQFPERKEEKQLAFYYNAGKASNNQPDIAMIFFIFLLV